MIPPRWVVTDLTITEWLPFDSPGHLGLTPQLTARGRRVLDRAAELVRAGHVMEFSLRYDQDGLSVVNIYAAWGKVP